MEGLSVSARDLAQRLGVSHTQIYKLIKAGVLQKDAYGQMPLEESVKKYKAYVDGLSAKRRQAPPVDDVRVAEGGDSVTVAFNKAKLAEKTYQARLKELDYKVRTGELLERDKVDAEAAWLADKVKQKLMAIPPRVSSMCEGRIARDIEEIIADAINDALKDLQKVKYTGGDNGEQG